MLLAHDLRDGLLADPPAHLGLPDGDLRKASIKSLRFRLFEVPGRITYGQRKTWLHLPADWPWTPDLTASWQTIKTLPIPT
jgi:hypothetical protein